MKNKILIFCIASLFLLTCLSSMSIIGMKTTKESVNRNTLTFFNENDAETPIWDVGHSWTYDVTINGGIPPNLNIDNLKMNDLIFTVEQVLDDSYILSFSAVLTGSGTVKIDIISLSGTLQNTEMEGDIIVNKSKLTINELQNFIVEGYVKPNLLPKIPFNVEADGLLIYGTPLLNFPINTYDGWYEQCLQCAHQRDLEAEPAFRRRHQVHRVRSTRELVIIESR